MDRSKWMYEIKWRNTPEYLIGLDEFMDCAVTNMRSKGEQTLRCPCCDCQNMRRFFNAQIVRDHLQTRGFMKHYTKWIWHGEIFERSINVGTSRNVLDSRTEASDQLGAQSVENYVAETIVQDEIRVENIVWEEIIVENLVPECVNENDHLDDMMNDIEEEYIDNPEIFHKLFENSRIPLFFGCTKFTKISAIFKLYNLKAKNGWSDKSFTSLLQLLRDMLPGPNELPDSTYKAKKVLCPLMMEVERIHACRNDCILYRHEYSNLKKCPTCGASRYKSKGDEIEDDEDDKKKPAAKVLWYLPIIPRFQRIFSNLKDAKLLQWHTTSRKKEVGVLRHPADSPEWINIDRTFKQFRDEPRNLRLGLCTDGMNPYGNWSSRHSTWPVLLCVYNLPPWLCMKRRYVIMSMLIAGPKQPGNDIDVYLAPLLEDLAKLWRDGVRIFDAHVKEYFILRAMIFCTINDFPAYGNLSGYKNKGFKACPICQEETHSIRLSNCRKNVYLAHRRFLARNHPYRRQPENFDGSIERGKQPMPLPGRQVYNVVKEIKVQFEKRSNNRHLDDNIWKKKSAFWDLPYWQYLDVRHFLDPMHIIKNICDSLIGLLLNIAGKTKDSINARKDLREMGIRPELHVVEDDESNRVFVPNADWVLTKEEKLSFLKCLKSIKVPSGYSSNISAKVSIKEMKLIGLKSHDCHALMTQLLPLAIRGILKPPIRHAINKLCFFFNAISSKVLYVAKLDELQSNVVKTLCELEMHFPPSFFDVMVHLTIHLVREIKMCGSVFLRHMFPFKRRMGDLKGLNRSRSRPEGSIIEGYVGEEIIDFYTDYLDGFESIGAPKSRHEGRLQGIGTKGKKSINVGSQMRELAHLKVPQQLNIVAPYVNEHIVELRAQNSNKVWITEQHNLKFAKWFREKVLSQPSGVVSETLVCLARGPGSMVHTYQGYDLNGFTSFTKKQDGKSTVQNSGVTTEAISESGRLTKYYGWIEEIWELEYLRDLRMPLFLCKWIDIRHGHGLKKDSDGFISVDFTQLRYQHDPSILASKQVKQVFYVLDPADKKWHIVLSGKRHIVGVDGVIDEDEYDKNEEVPPFSTGIEPLLVGDDAEPNQNKREDLE